MSDVVLSVEGLQARKAVKPISFKLEMGHKLLLHAPPGMGKSIIMHSLAGIHRPRQGTVLFKGQDIHVLPPAELDVLRLSLGYLPGQGQLMSNLGLYENLVLPLRYHADLSDHMIRRQAMETLQLVGLDAVPGDLADRREKRLVALARTMILKPDLLLLDEPAEGMDPEHANEVWERLDTICNKLSISMIVAVKSIPEAGLFNAPEVVLHAQEPVS